MTQWYASIFAASLWDCTYLEMRSVIARIYAELFDADVLVFNSFRNYLKATSDTNLARIVDIAFSIAMNNSPSSRWFELNSIVYILRCKTLRDIIAWINSDSFKLVSEEYVQFKRSCPLMFDAVIYTMLNLVYNKIK